MTDPDCVFCKIIAGRISSFTVYEDDHTFAFLDIAPFEKGHVLVVPKYHTAFLTDLPFDLKHLFINAEILFACDIKFCHDNKLL